MRLKQHKLITKYNHGGCTSGCTLKIGDYLPTVFTISGYTGSESTPLPEVIYSTSSFSVDRFISLPLRSLTGSMKSNTTQHCFSFFTNNSCCSVAFVSESKENKYLQRTKHIEAPFRKYIHQSIVRYTPLSSGKDCNSTLTSVRNFDEPCCFLWTPFGGFRSDLR